MLMEVYASAEAGLYLIPTSWKRRGDGVCVCGGGSLLVCVCGGSLLVNPVAGWDDNKKETD